MTRSFRAALLGATALVLIGTTAFAQSSGTALPPIDVDQPNKPALKKAVTKPASAAPGQKTKQPAADAVASPSVEPSPASGSGTTLVGARSGSLGVPTTAEAKAEIERTPGAVDIVPGEEYQKNTPALTIKDALDYVPGVFVQPKWGEDTRLSIRGSGLSRNFHGRGVQLLVDGIIPITTSDGGGDFQEIDPSAYRYIEVYKGGNALRYGANSLGGAINFVMPTGYDADLFGARVDVGSFGLHKVAINSGSVMGAADYFVYLTAQEQDGFRDHSNGESVRGGFNAGFRLSENVETRFYFNANTIRQNIPGAVTKAEALTNPERAFVRPDGPFPLPFFPFSVGNDNIDRDFERNIDSQRVANRTTVRLAQGTFVEFGGFYFNRHLDHPILFVLDNQTDDYGGFARLVDDSTIGGFRNRLTLGANIHNGETHSRFFQSVRGKKGFLLSNAIQKSENTTVYGENSFFVLPTLAIVGGLSYVDTSREADDRLLTNGDQSGKATTDFWNPKVGFVWDVTPTSQVFATISRSGEAPTFGEISISTTSVTSLKPQEATTYEIGTRGGSADFRWDLAVYRADIENEFQCRVDRNIMGQIVPGTCNQINLDQTVHQGVELGVSAALVSGLLVQGGDEDKIWLNAAYTFNDFFFDGDQEFGDNDLPGAPRHFVRAELLYKHPSGIYFGPNVEWVPEGFFVDSANTLATDSYAVWGVKAGFDDGGRYALYVEGRNLSDEAYISSASIATRATDGDALFEPANGRAVYGGVQVRW